jgi:hypothetical protein
VRVATGETSTPLTTPPKGYPNRFVVILSPEAQGHIVRLPYDWSRGLRVAWENLETSPTEGRGINEFENVPARVRAVEGERFFRYHFGYVAIDYSVLEDIEVVYVRRVAPFIM